MDESKVDEARRLLSELHVLMKLHNERNWIRGVEAAMAALDDGSFTDAQSIYRTMTEGGRGLSEWYVPKSNFDEQVAVNRPIDDLRSKLWDLFNP